MQVPGEIDGASVQGLVGWWRRLADDARREKDERYRAASARARGWGWAGACGVLVLAVVVGWSVLPATITRSEALSYYLWALVFAAIGFGFVRAFALMLLRVNTSRWGMPATNARVGFGLLVAGPVAWVGGSWLGELTTGAAADWGLVAWMAATWVVAIGAGVVWSLRIRRRQAANRDD